MKVKGFDYARFEHYDAVVRIGVSRKLSKLRRAQRRALAAHYKEGR